MPTSEQLTEARERALLRVIESRASLLEALQLDSSQLYGLTPQDLGIADTTTFQFPGLSPASLQYVQRQKRGEFIPLWLTDLQREIYVRRLRSLVFNNQFALNAVNLHCSYVIGPGLKYQAVAKKGARVPDSLLERVQAVIDGFVQMNGLVFREREIVARTLIEGEAFVRTFPQENGLLALRTIEPEHVRTPNGSTDPKDSFGIVARHDDVESVEGYYVVEGVPGDGAQPEPVPADEVVHWKWHETPSTSKRGLSAFWAISPELCMADDLLMSTVSLAKARAKIAMVWTLENSTADVIDALTTQQAAAQTTDPVTGQAINLEQYRYASILRTTEGQKLEFPGLNVAAQEHVEILQMVLRAIASRFGFPEYMLTADASNANYSSTLIAESPFVLGMGALQDLFAWKLGRNRWPGPNRALIWRQLRHAVDIGLLPPEIFRLIDVLVTPPSLTVRDAEKKAQTDSSYHQMGVKCIDTIRKEENLDPDEEEAGFKKEREQKAEDGSPDAPAAALAGGGEGAGEGQGAGDLRATVGGSQAILALQQAVYGGSLARAAGIANAVLVFGFSPEEANQLFPEQKPEKTADDGQGAGGEGQEEEGQAGELEPFFAGGINESLESFVGWLYMSLFEGVHRDKRGFKYCTSDSTGKRVSCGDPAANAEKHKGKAPLTVQRAHKRIKDLLRPKLPHEVEPDIHALAEELQSMTGPELETLKRELGLRASGQTKAILAYKLADRSLRGPLAPETFANREPRAKPEENPKAEPKEEPKAEGLKLKFAAGISPEVKKELRRLAVGLARSEKVTGLALSDERKQEYFAHAQEVLRRMSPKALTRFSENQGAMPLFVPDAPSIKTTLQKVFANTPGVKDLKPTSELGGACVRKGGKVQLILDGDHSDAVKAMLPDERVKTARQTYAHEMAHAIDGATHELSNSPEWKAAWQKDIKDPRQLNDYARKDRHEGWAEFGRLLLAGEHDLASVREKYKNCWDVWEKAGLIPEGEGGKETELPDLFSEKVPLGGPHDPVSHADVRKPAPKPTETLREVKLGTMRFGGFEGDTSKAEAAFEEILGKRGVGLSSQRLANLLCLGDDARTTITTDVLGRSVMLESDFAGGETTRTFYKNRHGELVCHNDYFALKEDGPLRGRGAFIFASQVAALRKVGAVKIKTDAAGSPRSKQSFNGYVTWPKLGYDCDLGRGYMSSIRKEAPHIAKQMKGERIQDLFAVEGGAQWWEENGGEMDMEFDLRDGSRSMEILDRYMEKRLAREGGK